MTDTTDATGATNGKPADTPERVPTDVYALAELIRVMPPGPAKETGGDLWDRLHAQEGYDTARQLWAAAGALIDQGAEEESLLDALGTAFDDAVNAVSRVAQLQKRLAEVGNIEYAEGVGIDAAAVTRRAGLDLRSARALHRQA